MVWKSDRNHKTRKRPFHGNIEGPNWAINFFTEYGKDKNQIQQNQIYQALEIRKGGALGNKFLFLKQGSCAIK